MLLLFYTIFLFRIRQPQGTALIDLTNKFGELACKVPADVNLVEVMGTLTGTLTNLE